MALVTLSAADRAAISKADVQVVQGALSRLRTQAVPPWLPPNHPFPDGAPPKQQTAFAAVPAPELIELIAVRGPLHVVDGWSYLGRSLNALIAGQADVARHLAYYAELRAGLSMLASSGIGVFNKRNVAIDAAGAVHIMHTYGTHDMCWAAVSEWASSTKTLSRLVTPITVAGRSLFEIFKEFFPTGSSSAAGELMVQWGFDLRQGSSDRDDRNQSSYQPSALRALVTSAAEDANFIDMFWSAMRPNGVDLERHLLRILLESEAQIFNNQLSDYQSRYERLEEGVKLLIPFEFLTRETDAVDHDFILWVAKTDAPAHPYSMICRAGLLLKLATGMAEANLTSAGVRPAVHFRTWWEEFGASHGLWDPAHPIDVGSELWDDLSIALEDGRAVATDHRHRWISALGGNVMRMCEAERAALWGLFQ